MRWENFRRSSNVEDRRADASVGPGGFGARAGGLGIGTIVVLGLIGWAFGIDPSLLIGGAEMLNDNAPSYQDPSKSSPGNVASTPNRAGTDAPSDQTGQFVAAVLGDTEDRWQEIFRSNGKTYHPPKLVMFSGVTRSACGTAQSAMGPFYVPMTRVCILIYRSFAKSRPDFAGAISAVAPVSLRRLM